jgi:hypothetical protein
MRSQQGPNYFVVIVGVCFCTDASEVSFHSFHILDPQAGVCNKIIVSSNFVQVPTAIVSKLLKSLCNPNQAPSGSPARKKRKVHVSKTAEEPNAAWPTSPELELSYTTSLLEVLLWLPITSDR